ncbi:MAG: IS66 family transposase [Chloroflexota bacterium]
MESALEIQVKENAELRAELKQARAEIVLLNQKIQLLLKRIFGRKSEKLDSAQLELLLAGLQENVVATPENNEPDPSPDKPRSTKKRDKSKPTLPADLPTERIVIDPPEVKANPENYKLIGEEVTEELDISPTKYFRRLIVRRKYTSRIEREEAPIIAELPARPIENSIATAGLLADIATQKYGDHIPLYRQERIMREMYGINLPRKTMADWMGATAEWLRPIHKLIGEGVRSSGYMQIDETPVTYLQAEEGGSSKGYFWVFHRPGGDIYFEWHTSRASDCLDDMLKDFKGMVQSDAYPGYACYARKQESIKLVGCWAHTRRKFNEALKESPRIAAWFLRQIGNLYDVERMAREKRFGPNLRQACRAAGSRMILARIKKALEMKKQKYLPGGLTGKAISYALNNWDELIVYCEDGQLEIDNNFVENAIRPTAVGKKNWLFIGHPDAGDRSAIIYTILACCRRLNINAREYLTDVLSCLPSMKMSEVATLTPVNWLAARTKIAA